jgi:hypothetical protein
MSGSTVTVRPGSGSLKPTPTDRDIRSRSHSHSRSALPQLTGCLRPPTAAAGRSPVKPGPGHPGHSRRRQPALLADVARNTGGGLTGIAAPPSACVRRETAPLCNCQRPVRGSSDAQIGSGEPSVRLFPARNVAREWIVRRHSAIIRQHILARAGPRLAPASLRSADRSRGPQSQGAKGEPPAPSPLQDC